MASAGLLITPFGRRFWCGRFSMTRAMSELVRPFCRAQISKNYWSFGSAATIYLEKECGVLPVNISKQSLLGGLFGAVAKLPDTRTHESKLFYL